ncbi:MAG: hypothetical protein ACOC2L_05620, partial [Candidatus Sumerlaeota bacterium]
MTEAKHQNPSPSSSSTEGKVKRPRIRLRTEDTPPPAFEKKLGIVKVALNVAILMAVALFVALGLAPIEEHYNAEGVVRPAASQNLRAAKAVEMRQAPLVEEGHEVEQGQVLMRFHLPELEQRILDLKTQKDYFEAELQLQRTRMRRLEKLPLPKEFWEIEEQVEQSKQLMEFHRSQLGRTRKLAESGITSEIDEEKNALEYERAKIQYERLKSRLALVEEYSAALLAEAKAEEKRLESRIKGFGEKLSALKAEKDRLSVLKAKADGIILDLPHKNTRGLLEAGTVLVYMSIGEEKVLEIFGLQKNFDRVLVGQPVLFKSEIYDPLKSGYGKGVVKQISR